MSSVLSFTLPPTHTLPRHVHPNQDRGLARRRPLGDCHALSSRQARRCCCILHRPRRVVTSLLVGASYMRILQEPSTPPASVLAASSTMTVRTSPPSLICSTIPTREFSGDQIQSELDHDGLPPTVAMPAATRTITRCAARLPVSPVRRTRPFDL